MMNPPNDEFLYVLRKVPDPEFAHALHQRLNAPKAKSSHMRRWLNAAVVVGLIFAALIIASPEVRAQISQQIERLFYGPVELRVVRSGRIGDAGNSSVPIEHLSPADAQNVIAHKTVTWVPESLTQKEYVTVIHYSMSEPSIGYVWVDANGERRVSLSIWKNSAPQMVIGQGSNSHEVEIDGHIGSVYNGGWEDGLWTPEGGTNLVWVIDGVTYILGSDNLPESDLLRMAESVQ